MKQAVHIRLALYTELGPVGHRLQRGAPLPVETFNFPDTAEGRKEATEAAELLNAYIAKHQTVKKPK